MSRQSLRITHLILLAALLTGQAMLDGAAADELRGDAKIDEAPITQLDREHWSFRPLTRPSLPTVLNRQWPRTPIDHFILAQQEQQKLASLPPVDRRTWIRRASFDLVGLPPTPDEVEAFVGRETPDAYGREVDRLLASPRYGQRWAQHWLDLARFAETDGFEHDKARPKSWQYRDWVIDALNDDLPYDRFVQLQIAGDEMARKDKRAVVATSFCLSGPDMPDINSMEERRHNLLNEMTATVGSVFLGLQLGCSQCHDHKYDPISQADFYRLRAIFEPAVHVTKNKSIDVLHEPPGEPPTSFLMIRGSWQRPGPAVTPAVPRIANPWQVEISASGSSGRRAELARWLTRPDHPLATRVVVNRIWQFHFGQGLSRSPSDFGIMGDTPTHSGLLDWLAGELVRRQWSWKRLHRLVCNSAVYQQASHVHVRPWTDSQKDVAQQRWNQSFEVDPDNLLLTRFPRRRLEGEAIRDSMLSVAGVLSSKAGGPGLRPPLPDELKRTLLKGQWIETKDESEHDRRSIYIFARRNLRFPMFEVFDRPDANASCEQRSRSTTAPQSLLMINSEFSLQTARRMAGSLLSKPELTETSAQVIAAFERALSRRPTMAELESSTEFFEKQAKLLSSQRRPPRELALPDPLPEHLDAYRGVALTDFCLALMNCNEFVYVD